MAVTVNEALLEYLGYFFSTEDSVQNAVWILENIPAHPRMITMDGAVEATGLPKRHVQQKLKVLKDRAGLVALQRSGVSVPRWYISYESVSNKLSDMRRGLRYAIEGK